MKIYAGKTLVQPLNWRNNFGEVIDALSEIEGLSWIKNQIKNNDATSIYGAIKALSIGLEMASVYGNKHRYYLEKDGNVCLVTTKKDDDYYHGRLLGFEVITEVVYA